MSRCHFGIHGIPESRGQALLLCLLRITFETKRRSPCPLAQRRTWLFEHDWSFHGIGTVHGERRRRVRSRESSQLDQCRQCFLSRSTSMLFSLFTYHILLIIITR